MTAIYSAQRAARAVSYSKDRPPKDERLWQLISEKYKGFPVDVQEDLCAMYQKASVSSGPGYDQELMDRAYALVCNFESCMWGASIQERGQIEFRVKHMIEPPWNRQTRILAKTALKWLDSKWYDAAVKGRWSMMSVFGVPGVRPMTPTPRMTGLMYSLSFPMFPMKLEAIKPNGRAKFLVGVDRGHTRRIGEKRFPITMAAGARPFWEALMPRDD